MREGARLRGCVDGFRVPMSEYREVGLEMECVLVAVWVVLIARSLPGSRGDVFCFASLALELKTRLLSANET